MKHFRLKLALGAALAALWVRGAPAEGRLFRLNDNVVIRRAVIQLADLLPADAPAALEEAGKGIALGRAPQPGSMRRFDDQQIKELLTREPGVLRQISIPSRVTVWRSGWPISARAIRAVVFDFLRSQAEDEIDSAAELDWPGNLTAAEENPALEVTAASWADGYRKLQIHVRCLQRDVCGSFLVRASDSGKFAAQLPRRLSLVSQPSPGQGGAAPTASGLVKTEALAEAGEPATLFVESGNVQISMAVVCLQRGSLRQEIRVRDVSSQRVFRAQVLAKGRLLAVF